MVHTDECNFRAMLESAVIEAYRGRLREAMGLADKEPGNDKVRALAAHLGISYTAAAKIVRKKGVFNAVNSANAAKFLNVDHHWLATGEGSKVAPPSWPFPEIDRARFDALEPYQRTEIQGAVRDKIKEFEMMNKAPPKDKTEDERRLLARIAAANKGNFQPTNPPVEGDDRQAGAG